MENKKTDREKRKDRDRECEKERDFSRENGRTYDSEKERLKDYEKKDVVRLKERDRKEKTERERTKDVENRKELSKTKKDFGYEKDKKRQEDSSLNSAVFDDRPLLKPADKESCPEKTNHSKDSKPSKNAFPGEYFLARCMFALFALLFLAPKFSSMQATSA